MWSTSQRAHCLGDAARLFSDFAPINTPESKVDSTPRRMGRPSLYKKTKSNGENAAAAAGLPLSLWEVIEDLKDGKVKVQEHTLGGGGGNSRTVC